MEHAPLEWPNPKDDEQEKTGKYESLAEGLTQPQARITEEDRKGQEGLFGSIDFNFSL